MTIGGLRNNDGFSLLEALIASVILATAILSLAQLLILATIATASAGRTTDAALLAEQKIEELRASSSVALEEPSSDSPRPGFAREWSVSALPSDPDHVALIQVVVRAAGRATYMAALKTRGVP